MDAALYAHPSPGRPWVRSNFVTTIDGAVTDGSGVSGSLGGEADERAFSIMRSLADVVLVGAGTARAEGYGPVNPDELDLTLPDARIPRLALVSRRLDVPERLQVPGVLVVTTTQADGGAADELERAGVEVLRHGDAEIDWPAALADLADRGLSRVLCEGGPSLHGELLAQGHVDEVCLTIAPVLTSGGPGIVGEGAGDWRADFRLAHALSEGGVLLTRWTRERPA